MKFRNEKSLINVFPCAALTGDEKVLVYYGAADTLVVTAFGYFPEIISFIKNNLLYLWISQNS